MTESHIRRRTLLAAGAAALATPPLWAQASYPSRPIRILVGAGAGGTTDLTARLVGEKMGHLLGQPVVIENRPGASGTLSVAQTLRAPADGHTLVWVGNSVMAISPYLYKNPGYDVKTVITIGQATTSGFILVASPSLGVNNVKELVAYGKAHPGKLSFGSNGVNGSLHLLAELLKSEGGFDALHVPYKGGAESAAAIMGGNIHFLFDALSSNIPLVRSGKLKALAVTGPQREKELPEVPTMAEQGFPGMTTEVFFGLVAAPGTPEPIVSRLNETLKTALADPTVKDALERSGNQPKYSTPQQFRALVDKEGARFEALLKAKGINPE
ncbi:tripartite tricarboxylate transporter substrate binding protein [Xenophilus arseniciresistens]|uniref:Tripartite tricarboxylate transporter substrate binding protein n=1 Tax=Xenophilus arseniciresistens TaxID=1283306 RepID=A0AAE3NAX2_9BURK|nr:tripartite tricarboxylate transporter substrate binding protein [Xenophilus arseniciresistens]MDA7418990.1 tripartite tricarboxylate transporter substrate binding protein [Xenophilus arseniciresistens]